MKPVYLGIKETTVKAWEAYLAGELSAQGPTPACLYRDRSGRPCAVGVALTDEQADSVFGTVGDMIEAGHITTDNEELLDRLQINHDVWASEIETNKHKAETAFVDFCKGILGID